jgi:hypothetical protein
MSTLPNKEVNKTQNNSMDDEAAILPALLSEKSSKVLTEPLRQSYFLQEWL